MELDRRTFVKGFSAAAFGGSTAGCVTASTYGDDEFDITRKEVDEIQLHSSADFTVPRYARVELDDDQLLGMYVDEWTEDAVKVAYDLDRLSEESVETVDSDSAWMERGDVYRPSDAFSDAVDADLGIELAAINWEPDLAETDHDAYFVPADDDTFTYVDVDE